MSNKNKQRRQQQNSESNSSDESYDDAASMPVSELEEVEEDPYEMEPMPSNSSNDDEKYDQGGVLLEEISSSDEENLEMYSHRKRLNNKKAPHDAPRSNWAGNKADSVESLRNRLLVLEDEVVLCEDPNEMELLMKQIEFISSKLNALTKLKKLKDLNGSNNSNVEERTSTSEKSKFKFPNNIPGFVPGDDIYLFLEELEFVFFLETVPESKKLLCLLKAFSNSNDRSDFKEFLENDKKMSSPWNTIRTLFVEFHLDFSQMKVEEYLNEFFRIHLDKYEDFSSYSKRFEELARYLKIDLNSTLVLFHYRNRCPKLIHDEYRSSVISANLNSKRGVNKAMTFKDMKRSLRAIYEKVKSTPEYKARSKDSKEKDSKEGKDVKDRDKDISLVDKSGDRCSYCGIIGHKEEKCRKKARILSDRDGSNILTTKSITQSGQVSSGEKKNLVGAILSEEEKLHNIKPIIFHGLINKQPLDIFIDLGCFMSNIDREYASASGFEILNEIQTFEFLDKKVPPMSTLGKCLVTIEMFGIKLQTYVAVIDSRYSFTLGLDLHSQFGIDVVVNLPPIMQSEDDVALLESPRMAITDPELDMKIKEMVEDLLTVNRSLKGFTTHPLGVVELNYRNEEIRGRYIPQYEIHKALLPYVDKQVMEWLDNDIIEECSPDVLVNNPLMVSPTLDETGKIKKVRICIHPVQVNENIVSEVYPIADPKSIISKVAQSPLKAELDLSKAFNQMMVATKHRYKLTFTHARKAYHFKGVPFGISSISSKFQRLVDHIFASQPYILTYIDNIIILGDSFEMLASNVRTAIELLNTFNLRLNLEKCTFGAKSISILGWTIGPEGISISDEKKDHVQRWKTPENREQVQHILGFLNYLSPAIPHLATKTRILNQCLHGGKFNWNEECTHAFMELKTEVLKSVTLRPIQPELPLRLCCDASTIAVSAILWQSLQGETLPQPNNVISFHSKALSGHQLRWHIFKLEVYAVITGLRHFHSLLYLNKFHLYTDSKSLSYLSLEGNRILNNWYAIIREYNFQMHFIRSSENKAADSLSRISYIESDLDLNKTSNNMIGHVHISTSTEKNDYDLKNLSDNELRSLIESEHALGHFGKVYILGSLRKKGVTDDPRLSKMIDEILAGCLPCVQFNVGKHGYSPASPVLSHLPMEIVQLDLISSLPETPNKNKFVLIILDLFTGFVFLKPLRTKSANEMAVNLLEIFCSVGFPTVFCSDNGSEFSNSTVEKILQYFNSVLHLSTPYHPQSKARVERKIRSVVDTTLKLLEGESTSWDVILPLVSLFLNLKIDLLSNSRPFDLFYGRSIDPLQWNNGQLDKIMGETGFEDIVKWKSHMKNLYQIIFPILAEGINKLRVKNAKLLDSRRYIVPTDKFVVGAHVMILDVLRRSKTEPRYVGPYEIKKINGNGSFILTDQEGELNRPVPINQLKLIEPSSSIIQDEYYEVQEILKHKGPKNNRLFLVQWRGFDELTWIPRSNFADQKMLKIYAQKNNLSL